MQRNKEGILGDYGYCSSHAFGIASSTIVVCGPVVARIYADGRCCVVAVDLSDIFGSVVLVTMVVAIFGETAQLHAFLIPQQQQQRGDDFLWVIIFLIGIYALAPLAYATGLGWSGVVVTSTATFGLLRVCRSFHS